MRGFSLLELLVAFAIMAMSLAMIYRAVGGSVRNVSAIEDRQRASWVVESVLAQIDGEAARDGWRQNDQRSDQQDPQGPDRQPSFDLSLPGLQVKDLAVALLEIVQVSHTALIDLPERGDDQADLRGGVARGHGEGGPAFPCALARRHDERRELGGSIERPVWQCRWVGRRCLNRFRVIGRKERLSDAEDPVQRSPCPSCVRIREAVRAPGT